MIIINLIISQYDRMISISAHNQLCDAFVVDGVFICLTLHISSTHIILNQLVESIASFKGTILVAQRNEPEFVVLKV